MASELQMAPEFVEAERLVEGYDRKTSFCFTSPTRVLIAKGPYTELNEFKGTASEDLLAALSERGLTEASIVGAVPFDTSQAARLLLPGRLLVGPPLSNVPPTAPASQSARRVSVKLMAQERRHFCAGVSTALREIERGALDKVVLSRTLDVEARGETDIPAVVRRLLLQNAGSYGFALQLRKHESSFGDNAVFFGASPEVVLAKRGARIVSHPLAGSVRRSPEPDEDRERARRLLLSEKDLREHAYVVADVAARLEPECRRLHVPSRPELVQTPTMWHLGTRIDGELSNSRRSSLQLALLLHPTPAVCGASRGAAQALIADLERRPRGFYTGLVGWCDAQGDGEWALAIRCARGDANGYQLYAGAGIVAGSDPIREWQETEAKLGTLLNALGIASGSEGRA